VTTYVGFLRAINLGATRRFPKAAIVAATEAAGFTDVATHINTGNVRFESRMRSRARIEEALERAYLADRGFEVPTMVFTAAELCRVADDADRFGEGHEGRHYVSLLKSEPSPAAIEEMESLGGDGARVHVAGRAVHLLLEGGYIGASVDNARVERLLGPATNRTMTVIRAVVTKWC
jgi:uncharacterized protein (DUF1697 family)